MTIRRLFTLPTFKYTTRQDHDLVICQRLNFDRVSSDTIIDSARLYDIQQQTPNPTLQQSQNKQHLAQPPSLDSAIYLPSLGTMGECGYSKQIRTILLLQLFTHWKYLLIVRNQNRPATRRKNSGEVPVPVQHSSIEQEPETPPISSLDNERP
jgi:hypothetical protein